MIGLDALSAICAAVSIPVVAIGGVGALNAREVVEAGAAGVAVVSAVFGQEDPAAATERILQAWLRVMKVMLITSEEHSHCIRHAHACVCSDTELNLHLAAQ